MAMTIEYIFGDSSTFTSLHNQKCHKAVQPPHRREYPF
jgi:hypothetical protein